MVEVLRGAVIRFVSARHCDEVETRVVDVGGIGRGNSDADDVEAAAATAGTSTAFETSVTSEGFTAMRCFQGRKPSFLSERRCVRGKRLLINVPF